VFTFFFSEVSQSGFARFFRGPSLGAVFFLMCRRPSSFRTSSDFPAAAMEKGFEGKASVLVGRTFQLTGEFFVAAILAFFLILREFLLRSPRQLRNACHTPFLLWAARMQPPVYFLCKGTMPRGRLTVQPPFQCRIHSDL